MKEFRKTATVRAVQFTEAMAWGKITLPDGVRFGSRSCHPERGILYSHHHYIDTLEGRHDVQIGDWIATGIKGEHWPIKPDIFAATYEEAAPSLAVDAEVVTELADDYRPSKFHLSNAEVNATGTLCGGAVANIARELLDMRAQVVSLRQRAISMRDAAESNAAAHVKAVQGYEERLKAAQDEKDALQAVVDGIERCAMEDISETL